MYKRSVIAVTVAASSVLLSTVAAAGGASAATGSRAIPNSRPAWTAHAKSLGRAKSQTHVKARVYLSPRGGLQHLEAAATAMATPGSATYRKFVTAAQFKSRYAPTSATVSSVSAYLRSQGLHVSAASTDNRYVSVRGTVAAANKAFSTSIVRYHHAGQSVRAPSTALRLPARISPSVLTVIGLDTTKHMMKPQQAPPAGFRNARPCSLFYGQIAAKNQADFTTPLPTFNDQTLAYAPCGYTGPQLRAAYEGNTDLDGSGVTVGITDAYGSKTLASDTNTYAENNGDGSYLPGQLTQSIASPFTHQNACLAPGWASEESLDVEAVHAMAPGANIHYYGAASCFDNDLLDALAQAVIDDNVQLVTNSWGSPSEGESADSIPAYEAVFLQGAVEGISFMFSSGDNGDELAATAIRQADYPTSDPYVTSVGGTSTGIGANGNVSFQTGWGTVKYSLSADGSSWNPVGFLYGSGGGASSLFNQPAYQAGTTPGPYRQVPDVAMDADPNTGMLIGLTQKFPDGTYYDQYRIGGTSLASPLFAGITALTLENAGGPLGLLNPTIYANQSAFTDVRARAKPIGDVRVDFANGVDGTNGLLYSVRTFNQDSSLTTHKGWDNVTGLGTAGPAWITAVSPAP
jgi:subtilase family serine protease